MTDSQRLNALNDFKTGQVDYLLATDLASRGLDIKGVETVINYDMPGQLAQYTHRVGRTARAGRKGRSVLVSSVFALNLTYQFNHIGGRGGSKNVESGNQAIFS